MTAEACRAVFEAAEVQKRAERLDEAFPSCYCEPWSLTETGGPGIDDGGLIARILTSPDAYSETTATILTERLTHLYSMGMSVVRAGASDQEIADTVNNLLTNAAEQKRLVGAVVLPASAFRTYANDDDASRWFAVYATDDRGKLHHGDVFGTRCSKKQQSRRRHKLAEDMLPHLVAAADVGDLIQKLRQLGM